MRKKHLLGLAVAGAAAVAWFCFREDESNLERTWRWAEGNSSYDFELELHQRAEFWGRDQQGIGLDLAAKGILNLTSSGCPRFPCELAVELEALNLEEFELLGARLAENPEGEPIGGLLLVERDGRVDGIRPGEGTTKVGEALLHLLAAELSWPEAEEPTWRERLTSLIGTAEVEFVRGRDEIQRKTLGFSELNLPSGGEGLQLTVCGSARAQFGADHIFASITAEDSVYGRDSDQRQVVSVDKRFVFERRAAATRRVSVGALSVDARPLGQIPFDEEGARAELLRQRLDGFGLEQLREGLRAYRAGGEVADHAQWLWKAVALLRHDDSACRELEQEFAAAGGAVRYRALLVDLLVGAGSTQAQESLRMMLGTKEARSSPTFGNLVQRLAHLNRPDAHTLEFVRDAYTDDGVDQMSAAAALGGVAGNVYRSGGRADAGSGPCRSPIPAQADHPFRPKPIANSGHGDRPFRRCRSPIPVMAIGRSGGADHRFR